MRWNGTAPATLIRCAALLHPRARVISFSQVGWHLSIEPDPNPAVEVINSDSDSEDDARVASPLGRVGSVFGPHDAGPHDAAALDRLAIARTGVARYAA